MGSKACRCIAWSLIALLAVVGPVWSQVHFGEDEGTSTNTISDPGAGSSCAGNPCPGQTCNEVDGQCVGTVTLQPPMGSPLLTLNADQLARFEAGAADFNSDFAVGDGLGPIFNQTSCGACHSNPLGGAGSITVNRFGQIDGATLAFDPLAELGGSLQQSQAISDDCAETIPFPPANVVARRLTNSALGFGLVEALSDESIQANETNPPSGAVSGRARIVDVLESPGETRVGRFGWKSQLATVLSFSGDAALNEMGMTNRIVPNENAPNGDLDVLAACDTVDDPEDFADANGLHFIDRVTDFQRFLAPPPQTPRSGMTGEALFAQIGCADCHVQSFVTPTNMDDESDDEDDEQENDLFENKMIYPYSDFLIHDMGFNGDFIADGDAGITEMRTAPLWGMRSRDPLWHDGRVAGGDLSFRVLFPGGIIDQHNADGSEAQPSAQAFLALTTEEQGQVINFLDSLGRREFDMDGNDIIDEFDAAIALSCFTGDGAGTVSPDEVCAIADVDQDQDVDDNDLLLLDVALGLPSPGSDTGDDEAGDGGDVGGPWQLGHESSAPNQDGMLFDVSAHGVEIPEDEETVQGQAPEKRPASKGAARIRVHRGL